MIPNDNIIDLQGGAYLPSFQAVIQEGATSRELIKEAVDSEEIGGYEIVPWGDDNNLPAVVMEQVRQADVVQSNLLFNICVGYGHGLKPMLKTVVDGKATYAECEDQAVLDFFDNNDIEGYFLEQLTDMHTFFNVFSELILDNAGKNIVSLRHREATFSRWGTIQPNEGRIMRHYYSVKWDDSPTTDDIYESKVLDRFNPSVSLTEYLEKDKPGNFRYIMPVSFPTPGRSYYQFPYWWSIFQSGWYDFLVMIPKIKKALLKNQLGVRYMIYLHPNYFDKIFKDEGIDLSDQKAIKSRRALEYQAIQDFAVGEENAGKGLITFKNYRPVASGVIEEKYIEILPLKNDMAGGELIADSEEVSNIISYAMQTHSSLIGSTPGKNKGSFSGTDKRELYLMKQAMMSPFINRILRPLYLVKKFNKWPSNLVFINPTFEFTTLDQNKSGQQINETE